MARVLGLLSIALGVVQLVVPRRLLGIVGLAPTTGRVIVTRLVGLRELMVAPGVLAVSRPTGWLAARVVGDVTDLALLAAAWRTRDARRRRVVGALGAVAAILAVDAGATVAARRVESRRGRHPGRIVRVATIRRPADELYRFWRDLENLPRLMPHLQVVEARGGTRSHWVARGPLGSRVEWEAEIVDDRPGERLSWRSIEGSEVRSSGAVRFEPAPGERGTQVTVEMEVDRPGGPIGAIVAMASGEDPTQQVADALRRFKQIMETGEALVSDATAPGRKLLQRPAQPADEPPSDPDRLAEEEEPRR